MNRHGISFAARNFLCKAGLSLYFLLAAHMSYAQEKKETKPIQLDSVQIIGITPLPGTGISKDRISGKVQIFRNADISKAQSLDLPDLLNRNANNVHLNDATGNAMQADLSFRGFTSSSLLGSPQGLAVYSDGVRINELFGDVVNWEILPFNAIANLELVSGSNPLFGLNALGGAISIQTKSGFTHPGTELMSSYGSFGKLNVAASTGGNNGRFGYFVSVNHLNETGWRQHSPSNVDQFFTKLSWRLKKSEIHFSTGFARSLMAGNGDIPVQLMAMQRDAVFTWPDLMRNQLLAFNLQHQLAISSGIHWTNNVYARGSNNITHNGDTGTYGADATGYLRDLNADGSFGPYILDQNGNKIVGTAQDSTAINNVTSTKQKILGITSQFSDNNKIGGHDNYLLVGMNAQAGRVNFDSQVELGQLSDDREFIGSGIVDETSSVSLKTQNTQASLYFFDSFSISNAVTATASANATHSQIALIDEIDKTNDASSLNGNHSFNRFNPSLGLIYELSHSDRLFFTYAVSSRNPSPIELECANPMAPCRLPNSFLSDPSLKPVVARTAEIGWSGNLKSISYELNAFTIQVNNDIYFVSSGPSRNSGYFANVGNTRRAGLEAGITKTLGIFRWQVEYSYTLSTFEENITVTSPYHPDAVAGEINVKKGNQIPLMPNNLLKIGADVSILKKLILGADLVYNGKQYMRGDEANLLAPLAAYYIVILRTQYRLSKKLSAFAKVYNLFNRKYETFGELGDPTGGIPALSHLTDPRFRTPSSPTSIQAGVRCIL